MATIQESIGQSVSRARSKARMSGNALAKAAGISQPFLWQIEAGIRQPGLATLEKIADALGVSIKSLLP